MAMGGIGTMRLLHSKNARWLVLAPTLLAFGTLPAAGKQFAHKRTVRPPGELAEQRKFKDYTYRFYINRKQYEGAFEILRRGKQVYAHRGGMFMIDLDDKNRELIGRDITGDGQPDLVVSEFGNGAHGPYYTYVFQIGKTFRHIATIAGEDDRVRMKDVDKDGKLEAVLKDWTFAYWNASFAASPAPTIILRYRNGNYRVATDLMKKPAPSASELDKISARTKAVLEKLGEYPSDDFSSSQPSELWGTMLDLIYIGHADLAYKFFDATWPPTLSGKEQFLNDFREQLAKSPYWPDVKAMNRL
jgi:hypothetical protein